MDSAPDGRPASFLPARVLSGTPTWQLVVNTGTIIVTFVMAFLIHRTQNKDGRRGALMTWG